MEIAGKNLMFIIVIGSSRLQCKHGLLLPTKSKEYLFVLFQSQIPEVYLMSDVYFEPFA